MNSLDLSICIVNWNAESFLVDCLNSILKAQPTLDYELVVVDNASTDQSVRRVKDLFPQVHLIVSEKNGGFAAANNLALKEAAGRHLLLLNPDTLVMPRSLEAMVEFMDSNQEAGACGCRLFHPETGRVEASARPRVTLPALLWHLSYLDLLFPASRVFNKYRLTYLSASKPQPVDWITGACLMVRNKIFRDVGSLDENMFMYWEDAEWCYRMKRAGWDIYYLPLVKIAHYRGQSSRMRTKTQVTSLSGWATRQYTASLIYFYYKHFGKGRAQLLRLIIIATSILKAFLWALGGLAMPGNPQSGQRVRSYLAMIPAAVSSRGSAKG